MSLGMRERDRNLIRIKLHDHVPLKESRSIVHKRDEAAKEGAGRVIAQKRRKGKSYTARSRRQDL